MVQECHHVTAKMTAARHKKLEMLQQREAAKVRVAKVAAMLTQKYTRQFSASSKKDSTAAIERTVQSFLQRNPVPSEADLAALEQELKAVCSGSTGSSKQGKHANNCDASAAAAAECGARSSAHGVGSEHDKRSSTVTASNSQQQQQQQGASVNNSSNNNIITGHHGQQTNVTRDWRAFDVAKQIEYEEQQQKKREKQALDKVRLRQELNQQKAQVEAKHAEESAEKKKYLAEEEAKLVQWHKEQAAAKAKIIAKHTEEKKIREEQIAVTNARREAEKQDMIRHEQTDMARYAKETEAEALKIERRKCGERERLARIRRENADHKIVLEQRAKEAAADDIRLMHEYKARLDKEENDRAAKLRERVRRYEEIGTFWSERGAGKAQSDEQRRMELLILEEAAVKDKADTERERRDKEKKKIGAMTMALDNRRVMEERRRQRAIDDEIEKKYADATVAESEAHRKAEADRLIRQRGKMQQYRTQLEQQAAEAATRKQEVDMNETEALLNSDLVKKLETDTRLQERVRTRLGQAV